MTSASGSVGFGDQRRVVVIGGGIAGLAAAHRLCHLMPGAMVTVVEAEPRLGGKIRTDHVDGFTIEGGPDSFLSIKPRGVGLCHDLGIADRLRGTTTRPHRAYVARGERLYELPEGLSGLVPTRLGPIARSGLLSPRGKARLALDYLRPARRESGDETLAAFVRRRLGGEAYDRLIEPLMAGIYAGNGDRLSLAATFPHLQAAEQQHGGLIRGVLAARAASQVDGRAPAWPPFVTLAGGMGELVETLGARLRSSGVAIFTSRPVAALCRDRTTYRVVLADGDSLFADGVVLATPAFAAAEILGHVDPDLVRTLAEIPHASSAIVSMAFPQADVPRPLDAHGYVIPRVEARAALACTWTSAKWAGRAPTGWVLLRVFLGRFGQDEMLAGDDDELVALARSEIRRTLGVTREPTVRRVHRWPRGMPQYTLGHGDRLVAIGASLARQPGLALVGAAYDGVGLPDCIRSGEAGAERVAAALAGVGGATG